MRLTRATAADAAIRVQRDVSRIGVAAHVLFGCSYDCLTGVWQVADAAGNVVEMTQTINDVSCSR